MLILLSGIFSKFLGAYEHHCAVKKCENICLPNSGGYQCTCPTGIKPVGSYCPNGESLLHVQHLHYTL